MSCANTQHCCDKFREAIQVRTSAGRLAAWCKHAGTRGAARKLWRTSRAVGRSSGSAAKHAANKVRSCGGSGLAGTSRAGGFVGNTGQPLPSITQPLQASTAVAASAQTSAFGVTLPDARCSGAAYRCVKAGLVTQAKFCVLTTFEMPKSANLNRPSLRMMLPGEMSRCSMPTSCSLASAAAV